MLIEGNVLANTLANSAAENAYQNTQTTRNALPIYPDENIKALAELPQDSVEPVVASQGISPLSNDQKATPGEKILEALQKCSENHTKTIKNLWNISDQLKDSESITMASALEMQKELMECQLKQELISKAANSISQGVQTLARNQ